MLKFSKECSRCTTRNEHPHEGPSQAQELVGLSGACLHGWLQVTPGRQEKVSSSRQRERVRVREPFCRDVPAELGLRGYLSGGFPNRVCWLSSGRAFLGC